MTRIVLILSLTCSWIASFAQEVSTYVSSKEVSVGEVLDVQYEISLPKGQGIKFNPPIGNFPCKRIAEQSNLAGSDFTELEIVSYSDTVLHSNGTSLWRAQFKLIPWDTGTLVLQPLPYTLNNQMDYFTSILIESSFVPTKKGIRIYDIDESITPIKKDFILSEFLLKYFWIPMIILLVILGIFWYKRRQRQTTPAPISLTLKQQTLQSIEKIIQKKFIHKEVPSGIEICEVQLFHLANKIKQTEINHDIDTYLPNINEVLEAFSKEELIKKVFSVEFTRFYNYYKKAKNLNVNAGDMSEGSKDTVRYFINIGGKDDFDWMSLKDFLKEMLGLDKDELYKVDVKESFSFFNTDSKHQELVMDFFKEFELEGRRVSVEISKDTGRGRRGGRDRGRGRDHGGFKGRGGERRGNKTSAGRGGGKRDSRRGEDGKKEGGRNDHSRRDSGNSGFKGRNRRKSERPNNSGTGGRRRNRN